VQLNGVRFSYDRGKAWALDGIDLTIRPGERICLTGPNGSGKSTLSRIIAGLVAPDCGTVQLLGHQVFDGAQPDPQAYRQARHGIGAVFQNPEDQIVTTVVEDDVAFGPENLGLPRPVIAQRLDAALEAVDMAAYRHGDPAHMSGGQQQRIAIAGTLAMAPSMIVLDEPTAMLDSLAQAEVMSILDALQARGTTIVHVTHRNGETAHADRVIRMEHGRIVADTNCGC
jgi:energy-coupling factor transport system ATP-binding protein